MTNSLWIPLWMMAIGAAHFFAPSWYVVAVLAVACAHLTAVLAYVQGPSERLGVLKLHGYTLEELARDVLDPDGENDRLPLCIGVNGLGLVPVTDWYTARVGGQRCVILEHIEGGI
mgnify:CR=1 FL=1